MKIGILIIFGFIFLICASGVVGCGSDAECPQYYFCDYSLSPRDCVKDCRYFLCPNDEICSFSKCYLPIICGTDSECKAWYSIDGYICVNGKCQVDCTILGCPQDSLCNANTKKCETQCNPANCNGYGCDVAGNCETSCAVNDDCNTAAGYTCNANKCTKSCQKNSECTLGAEYQCVAFKCKKMSCLTPTQTPSDCPFGGMVCDSDKICKNKCTVTGDCIYLSNGYNTGCSIINNLCTVGPACTDDTICISTFGVGAKCGANKLCAPPDCKTTLCPENYLCTSAIGCAKFSCTGDTNCAFTLDGIPGSCDKTTGFCFNDCTKVGGCPPNPAGLVCNQNTGRCELLVQQKSCSSDADCTVSGEKCISFVCKTPVFCAGDMDCPFGKVCVSGACSDKIGCVSTSECESWQICVSGACKCQDSLCGGYICGTNNKCTESCSSDADCITTTYKCDNTKCVKIEEKKEGCTDDAECTGVDEKCVNTKCIDTKAKSCVELGGITCESGYVCADIKTSYNSLTSAKCCIATTGNIAECVSESEVFVPSQAGEVFVKKGACVNGKREVQYCQTKDNCAGAEKSTEDCTAITRKGSSSEIPSFGLYAGIIALIVIIIYYLVFHKRNKTKNKKNVKKKSRRKILR